MQKAKEGRSAKPNYLSLIGDVRGTMLVDIDQLAS